ncbi:hypothetical protein YPPY03_3449 [Yersinia pestis PY-03]|nr:hypothetical protein YPPY03_3449 [Yersinia pestis PY-03]
MQFFIDVITRYICISNILAGHLKTHSPQPSHSSVTSVGGWLACQIRACFSQ